MILWITIPITFHNYIFIPIYLFKFTVYALNSLFLCPSTLTKQTVCMASVCLHVEIIIATINRCWYKDQKFAYARSILLHQFNVDSITDIRTILISFAPINTVSCCTHPDICWLYVHFYQRAWKEALAHRHSMQVYWKILTHSTNCKSCTEFFTS